MQMDVKLDSKSLERRLNRIESGAERTAENIVITASLLGMRQAQGFVLGGSGQLRASISPLPLQTTAEGAEGGWGSNSDHAGYVEHGTGAPGTAGVSGNGLSVDPAAAGYTFTLSKKVNKQGQPIPGWTYYSAEIGRFVHTVGQPPKPFMYPASQAVEAALPGLAKAEVRQLLKEK